MSDIAERLQACGTRRILSLVFEYLSSDHEWHTLRDIERKMDLRQPEVSMALKELAPYIEVRKSDRNAGSGRGRPVSEVRMSEVSANAFVDAVITNGKGEIKVKEAALEKLKDLV